MTNQTAQPTQKQKTGIPAGWREACSPQNWRLVKLGEVTEYLNRGITPKYSKNGVVVINQRCIRDGKVLFESAKITDPKKRKITKEKKLQDEDIVICSTGVGTLGRVAQIGKVEKVVTVDSHVTIVRGNLQVNKKFLGFNLRGREKEIEFLAEGSTGQTELQRKKLENLKILLPPLPEQEAIAEVLSGLDDKIDLLHRQNKILEDMAQALFRKWFIDEADEGWEEKRLGDFVSISSGKSLKKDEYIMNGKYQVFGANGKIGRTNKFLLDEKIIFTGRVGTLGNVFISDGKVWLSDNTLIVKPETGCFYFVYFLLKTKKLKGMNVGSTQPLIRQSDLKNITAYIPPKHVLQNFQNKVENFFVKINNNQSQIRTLENLRDTLLPKLMSGEVRVKF